MRASRAKRTRSACSKKWRSVGCECEIQAVVEIAGFLKTTSSWDQFVWRAGHVRNPVAGVPPHPALALLLVDHSQPVITHKNEGRPTHVSIVSHRLERVLQCGADGLLEGFFVHRHLNHNWRRTRRWSGGDGSVVLGLSSEILPRAAGCGEIEHKELKREEEE